MNFETPSNQRLNELFYIDEKFALRNKVKRGNRGVKDYILGNLRKDGYMQVTVDNKRYLIHRIIACMFDILPSLSSNLQIDHIDGNIKNNKPSNLRAVNNSINCKNQTIRLKNSTGFIGISYHKRNQHYTGFWTEKEKLRNVNFSVLKYGKEGAFNRAVFHRLIKLLELKDIEGYTDRHIYGDKKEDIVNIYNMNKDLFFEENLYDDINNNINYSKSVNSFIFRDYVDGKRKAIKSFSVKKYGYDKAKKMALEFKLEYKKGEATPRTELLVMNYKNNEGLFL